MAFDNVVRELVIKLRFAVDSSGMQQAEQRMNRFHSRLQQMGSLNRIQQNFSRLAYSARNIGLGLAASTGGMAFFLNEAGQFNKTRVAFETMTGSVEKGKALLEELHQFALKTPFNIQDVEQNAAMLLGMGIETEKILPTMKALGDVAAGINRPLGMVALNFGQIKTRGVLMGTELRDFARQGVPIIEQLAKQLNVSGAQIQEMSTKRQIPFEEVEKAFINMTSEGGRFANLMFEQAKTWPVMITNFWIRMKILSREVGQKLLPVSKRYLKALKDWIELNQKMISQNLISYFKRTLEAIKRLGLALRSSYVRIKELARGLGGLGNALKIIGALLLTYFAIQFATFLGSIIMGIGAAVISMWALAAAATGATIPAFALNVLFGFLPVLIGLAVIAIVLLADEIYVMATDGETALGKFINTLRDLNMSWETQGMLLGFVLDLVLRLINPFFFLASVITKLTTGKSIGEWFMVGLDYFLDVMVPKISKFFNKMLGWYNAYADWFTNITGGVFGEPLKFDTSEKPEEPVGPKRRNAVDGYTGGSLLDFPTRAEDGLNAVSGSFLGQVPGANPSFLNQNSRSVVNHQKNEINISGATNPEEMAKAVEKAVFNGNRALMNDTTGGLAVSPVGN